MIDPFGLKSMAGAAAGLPGTPPRTMPALWGHSGRLTATGRVADAPLRSWTGRSGGCLPNQAARTDGAMRWAADLGGSPLEDVGEGNPGEVFTD